MTRTEYINLQFAESFSMPVGMTLDEWRAKRIQDSSHVPFGYDVPRWDVESNSYVTFYSPDIIAETVKDESDKRFRAYLAAVIHHLLLHIAYENMASETTPENIEQVIDSSLYETLPGSLALMSEVQMAYLDRVQEH